MALMDSIRRLWEEASWCYVYGWFQASIILMAMLVEGALKLEFERRNLSYEGLTLGKCIEKAKEIKLLAPQKESKAFDNLDFVLKMRNDIVHGNIEKDSPESLLNASGSEHERRNIDISGYIKDGWITGDGEAIGWSLGRGCYKIYLYKRTAKETIENTRQILKFLYPESEIP